MDARVGRYQLVESIGEGAMGVVYAAYDANLDRRVAIKVLNDHYPGEQDRGTSRLEREAQALAAIIECTDVEFLPASKQEKLTKFGGREKLQERLTAIKQILEERR